MDFGDTGSAGESKTLVLCPRPRITDLFGVGWIAWIFVLFAFASALPVSGTADSSPRFQMSCLRDEQYLIRFSGRSALLDNATGYAPPSSRV